MSVSDELNRFNEFARSQVESGAADSMAELFDQWLGKHPSATEQSEAVRAVRQGLADIEAGRVHDFDQVNAEIRASHRWSAE